MAKKHTKYQCSVLLYKCVTSAKTTIETLTIEAQIEQIVPEKYKKLDKHEFIRIDRRS